MEKPETHAIHYTCPCGREWEHTYYADIQDTTIHLLRIVAEGTPPNDALCTCGKMADMRLLTPMPGYRYTRVRFVVPVAQERYSDEEQERRYEELVQLFIAQETAFISWERIGEIEETAAKLVEFGYSATTWQRLPAESQTQLLNRDPTTVHCIQCSCVLSLGMSYRITEEGPLCYDCVESNLTRL